MIDQNLLPSRQLHMVARLARWTLRLIAAFWLLLLAVGVVLHGFIVPRIGDWRGHIENIATKAVGAPVQIGDISARSEGIFPTVELLKIAVLDAQGQAALQLPRVVITLSARSVLRLGLEQLYIEAPELDVRRLADGRWQVAGFDFVQAEQNSDSSVLQWLLRQPEIALRKGVFHFDDALHGAVLQTFHEVDVVLRHHPWQHAIRMDAIAASGQQQRLQVMGTFRPPLLPSAEPLWERWSGQWYVHTYLEQLPHLPWPSQWGIADTKGSGAVRMWADIARGKLTNITADVALNEAEVAWNGNRSPALALHKLQARLALQIQDQNWTLQASQFSFQQNSGAHWPTSNWSIYTQAQDNAEAVFHLAWDYADLGMASTVAQSLPLPPSIQQSLARWQPQGSLRNFELQWGPKHYAAKGRTSNLNIAAQVGHDTVGIPGVQGASASFSLNERGGSAQLDLQDARLDFPGIFEVPEIPLQTLQAQLQWQVKDGHWKVQVPSLTFANTDAQGQLSGTWEMGANPEKRLPGALHLEGVLTHANAARVHSYLPLQLPESTRHYVRDSVQQGTAENVRFEVRGNLNDMPFTQPGSGRFYIEAPVRNVTYDFLPPSLHDPQQAKWPALEGLAGRLVFEGGSMEVHQASTGFRGHPLLKMASVKAHIPNLEMPHVQVSASGTAQLQPMLDFVRKTPLSALTDRALDPMQAQGDAGLEFKLDLPLEHLDALQVQGSVHLKNSELRVHEEVPLLQKLKGQVRFSEKGFELQNIQAQAVGGDLAIRGGMQSPQAGLRIQAQGMATAHGLQTERSLAGFTALTRNAEGQAAYELDIASQHGKQAIVVRSDLRGIALHLPAPLHKTAQETLPLQVAQTLFDENKQELRVDLAQRARVTYLQDITSQPAKVIAGRIMVGMDQEDPPSNPKGVTASIKLPKLDVDAWMELMDAQDASSTPHAQGKAYWPQKLHIEIDELMLRQRQINQIKARVEQVDNGWHGQVKAENLAGYVQYLAPNSRYASGRLFARLGHLSLPKASAQRLNEVAAPDSEPASLPALDIQIDSLTVEGRELGYLDLQAHTRTGAYGREWVLQKFDLQTSGAQWKANGIWGATAWGQPRSTQLSFVLKMDNAGNLLEHFGMPGVIRNGEGSLTGQIGWQSAPITPHWASMEGGIRMEVGKGQFLKVEPGIGKLLSVLSLQSLSRRITLDFRDVFSQGFAFDFVRGDIVVKQGIARTNNLQMKGLNAAVLMEGQASLVHETQDLQVVVVPEINAMTASLAATAINPVVGLGSFVAQMLFRAPLMAAATRTFHVHGSWSDPVVDAVQTSASESSQESRKSP